MPYRASDTTKKLIALLNNAKELSVDHSQRTLAIDTIYSCMTLCKSRNFGIKEGVLDILDSLIYGIRSYKPEVLLEEFHNTEEFIIILDMDKNKPPKSPQPNIQALPYADTTGPSSLI